MFVIKIHIIQALPNLFSIVFDYIDISQCTYLSTNDGHYYFQVLLYYEQHYL